MLAAVIEVLGGFLYLDCFSSSYSLVVPWCKLGKWQAAFMALVCWVLYGCVFSMTGGLFMPFSRFVEEVPFPGGSISSG